MIQSLAELSLAEFTQLVNTAFKNYQSTLALARSPLADSALVRPVLVLDDLSPTADERGQALRLLLQWAVNRLAPGPVAYPPGVYRPYDDPTWRDPHWWRYNILRHRYLEPLHPDEFVEGGRTTETLLALLGISSSDTFFDERNRAVREAAQRLQQQLRDGAANDELRQLALEEAYRPLQMQPEARALLEMAATFDDVFERALLLQMAAQEHLVAVERALDYLISQRFLQMSDGGRNLWLSPILQRYIYSRQPAGKLRSRHQIAASYALTDHNPLLAARHLQQAHQWTQAAQILLTTSEELINELPVDEICALLLRFKREHLLDAQWCQVHLLLTDLQRRAGRTEEAILACRRALKAASQPSEQAPIYWRLGKLYEKQNQLHALGYYQQARERFAATDPKLVDLLKDRAWLYLLRQEWQAAEADLQLALQLAPTSAQTIRADIYDALGHLYLEQKQFAPAIENARRALLLREEIGDLLQIAKSFGNLGNFYNRMGEVNAAIASHNEALALYEKLNNQELVAEALLNQGVVFHFAGRLEAAVTNYQKSLAISRQLGLRLVEATVLSNLAEALAQLGQMELARQFWQLGYRLSRQAGFDDLTLYFQELQSQIPALAHEAEPEAELRPGLPLLAPLAVADPATVELVQRTGQVTAKSFMTAANVSKATATRRLTRLVEQGVLQMYGKGRGVYYRLAAAMPLQASAPPINGQIEPQAAASSDVAQLRSLLEQAEPQLAGRFGLTALEVRRPSAPPTTHPPLDLWVRFEQLPDLPRFFALEAELGRLLGVRVDLQLADGGAGQDELGEA